MPAAKVCSMCYLETTSATWRYSSFHKLKEVSKSYSKTVSQIPFLKTNSCVWNMWRHWHIVGKQALMESATNEFIKKRSIPSNMKLI